MAKCIGIFGRMFGHKFIDVVGNHTGYCLRCGMPEGGQR